MNKSLKWVTLAGAAALTCVAFVACAPADLDAAKAKMEEAEYTVLMAVDVKELAEEMGGSAEDTEGIVCMIQAQKGTDMVIAVLCENNSKAKEGYDDMKAEFDEAGEEAEGMVVKKSGKWVVYGTEAAVDAFLK